MQTWSVDQLANLLAGCPELSFPRPPSDLGSLANAAQQSVAVAAAVAELSLPEHRLAQVLVSCPESLPLDELAAVLPEGVGLDEIEPLLDALEARALAWRHGGRVHWSRSLPRVVPSQLGPPIAELVHWETSEYLANAAQLLRDHGDAAGVDLPDRSQARSKPARIGELEALLAAPGLVAAVIEAAPRDAALLAAKLASGVPYVDVAGGLYFHPAAWRPDPGAYWLFERGLLLAVSDDSAVQPREVGLVLRSDRPVLDLELERPPLVTGTVSADNVDRAAVESALATLDQLTAVIDWLAAEPIKALKSGGIGIAALRRAAKSLDLTPERLALLLELATLGGLLETFHVQQGRGRRATVEEFVQAVPEASAWCRIPPARRWSQLGGAWLRAARWPSGSGRKDAEGRNVAVSGHQHDTASAPRLRHDVLSIIAELADEPVSGNLVAATNTEAVLQVGFWSAPLRWLSIPVGAPDEICQWIMGEAELLGFVALGRLSSFGDGLRGGDVERASSLFAALLPAETAEFTLQADLTAISVGRLEVAVQDELRLLADVESTGAATTFRFSDASVRRAFDEGRTAQDILAFLVAHAPRGVPGPLEFLVGDVARRYGNLAVHHAATVLVGEDPAVLADACSHKKTKKLGLRLVAATVAVSDAKPTVVRDVLRDAGFLPTFAPDGTTTVGRVAGPSGAASVQQMASLTEPFSIETDRSLFGRMPLSPVEAQRLAERLLSSSVDGWTAAKRRSNVVGMFDDIDEAGELGDLDALERMLGEALDGGRAVGLDVGGPQPLIVEVVGVGHEQVIVHDIRAGTPEVFFLEDVVTAVDLGPIKGLRRPKP